MQDSALANSGFHAFTDKTASCKPTNAPLPSLITHEANSQAFASRISFHLSHIRPGPNQRNTTQHPPLSDVPSPKSDHMSANADTIISVLSMSEDLSPMQQVEHEMRKHGEFVHNMNAQGVDEDEIRDGPWYD